MDLNEINSFAHRHWIEISGVFTLAVSLWVAFGPLRHRLPRSLTRFGRYSAALKMLSLSIACDVFLYRCLTDDVPSRAINWLLGVLSVALLAGSLYVFTRRPPAAHRPHATSRSEHAPGAPSLTDVDAARRIRSSCPTPPQRTPTPP